MKKTSIWHVLWSGFLAASTIALAAYDIVTDKPKRQMTLGFAAACLSALSFGIRLTSYVYQRYGDVAEMDAAEEDDSVIPEIVEPDESEA